MKKFISALSSLAIAATAMGGTLAITSNAATTKAVDKTIIEFRSKGERTIKAKAGDTVTVDVYVPQSSGLNTISGAICVNQNETLGQEGCKITNPETGEVVTKNANARGNYGIEMKNADFANPGCFDSGWMKLSKSKAGNLSVDANGYNALYTDTWTFLYLADMAVGRTNEPAGSYNIDAYAPFAKTEGSDSANRKWYANYEPTFTWDENVDWAYDYKFMTFDLVLPATLADGTYEVDILKEEYVQSSALFKANPEAADKVTSQILGNPTLTSNSENVPFETRSLKIQVGDAPVTTTTPKETTTTPKVTTTTSGVTTTTPKATTTTTVSTEKDNGDKIIYSFVPDDANATIKDGKYYVEAGQDLTLLWTVKNDKGTAGMQYAFDFSKIIAGGGSFDGFEDGLYTGSYQPGQVEESGRFELIYVKKEEDKLDDGSTVGTFYFTAPSQEGEYTIKLWTADGAKNQTVGKDDTKDPYPSEVKEFTIVVGDAPVTTTTVTTTIPKYTTTTLKDTTTTPKDTTTTPKETTTTPKATTTTTGTTTTTTMTTPPDGEIFWGDVNCDKKVSVADVVLLNRKIAGTAKVTAQGEKNADVVNDGTLDAKDSKLIKQYIAEKVEYSALGKK